MCQEDIDRRLRELALEAQRHPQGNLRRQVLEQFFKLLLPATRRIPRNIQAKIDLYLYDEAHQRVILEMCCNIDRYNPDRGEVLAWYKNLVKGRIKDVKKDYLKRGLKYFPNKEIPEFQDLDVIFSHENLQIENPSFFQESRKLQELRQLIEEDPDRMFSSAHVQGRPDANFQFLALAHNWENWTWREIAEKLGNISIQTIAGFYRDQLRRFIPFFRNYLSQ
jgi:hypothetical protein